MISKTFKCPSTLDPLTVYFVDVSSCLILSTASLSHDLAGAKRMWTGYSSPGFTTISLLAASRLWAFSPNIDWKWKSLWPPTPLDGLRISMRNRLATSAVFFSKTSCCLEHKRKILLWFSSKCFYDEFLTFSMLKYRVKMTTNRLQSYTRWKLKDLLVIKYCESIGSPICHN